MAKKKEPTIIFEDKEYLVSSLSDEAKANLQAFQFAEGEMNRLKSLLTMMQTASNSYRSALISNLPK